MRVAVLGTGSIGLQHAAALRAAGADPVLIPVRQARRRELEAAGYRTAADLAEAAAGGVPAAVIATDTARHPEDARAALRLGLDVLVEKPLGPTLASVDGLPEEARRLGRRGLVGCVLRCDPGLQRFRSALGRVGAIHQARVACQSYLPDWRPQRDYRASYSARAEEGGVLRDLIHEIDYAGWCLGWPRAVMARLRPGVRLGIDAEESAELWWEVGEARVSVQLDYLTRPTRRSITAMGSEGTLTWDFLAQELRWEAPGQEAQTERHPSTKEQRLAAEDAAFVRAVGGHSGAPLPDLAEGALAVAICDAAREASAAGRWATVPSEVGVA
jgi:predicted dehydrogenase